MKKRITSLLMALVLALSLVPATVWAEDATLVGTFEELKQAVTDNAADIVVTNDIELTETLSISGTVTIRSQEGSVFTLKRSASFTPTSSNTDYVFDLNYYSSDVTFQNIIMDGNKEAVQAKNGFISMTGSTARLTLGQGATIQNCSAINGGSAVRVLMGSMVMEKGSTIKDCTNTSNGGAIYINREPYLSRDEYTASLTINGATISGCSSTGTSVNYSQGGAIYAYGRVNLDIKNSTITGNSANSNGGAIYAQSHDSYSGDVTLNISDTTITGNTSQKLGGGVYFNGKAFTVSGVTDITGSTGSGSANNVYLAAKKTVDASGLEAGSHIGVSAANIPSTLITGYADDSENGYFTADRSDTKFKATKDGGLEVVGKDDHTHCICGRTDCDGTPEGHRMITCTGVSSLDLVKNPGSYYLLNDVTLTKTWQPSSGVTLCLNGHAIHAAWKTAAINLEDSWGFRFDLTDCGTDGKVTGNINAWGSVDEASGVIIGARATFNFYNGSICDNTLYTSGTTLKAGAVEVNGTFNMYGGSIKNNQGSVYTNASSNNIGGVLVNSTGKFIFMGGEISGNRSANDRRTGDTYHGGAVYVNGGYFKMTGGVIKNNIAGGSKVIGDGGAVYVGSNGTFLMTGGEITGNTASRNGGGVAVNNGTFTMSGDAKISDNSAKWDYNSSEHKGGGVFVGEKGTFTMSGDTSVEGNLARAGYTDSNAQGGGVYVSKGGTFTMSDNASIKSNTMTVQYNNGLQTIQGGGVFVGGTLNLSGGAIEENTAHYEGGGIYVDTNGTVNLGTGKITVQNNSSTKTIFKNLYLPGTTKLLAAAAPAAGSNIVLSLPLARIQKAEGSVVITNVGQDIKDNDSRFSFEAEALTMTRSGDDLVAKLPTHTHGSATYTPVYSLNDIKGAGNYYLVQDSTMTGSITIAADTTVNICLNGHKNDATKIVNNGTLNITDCKHDSANPGYITGEAGYYDGTPITNKTGATLTMDSVTVRDITGGSYQAVSGEGGSTVILKNSIFSDNACTALDVNGATATVTNCTFENNQGRAIFAEYNYEYNSATVTVTDSTFTGNSTESNIYGGGAIYCNYHGGITITGSTFTGNSTPKTAGGALWLQGKNMRIADSTFTGNSAGWKGGGIYLPYGSGYEAPVFSGKIIVEKNTADGVENNVHLNGSETWGVFVYADSNFSTSSKVGLTADRIPSLAVKGTTNTAGFFADNSGSYTLRPTTDSNGPHLVSANSDENHTGLELWHKGNDHTHCVCGTGTNTADSNHTTHTKVKWIGVTTLYDLPEGNYYLLKSISYPYGAPWTPVGNSNLCLNGQYYTTETYSYAPSVVVGKDVNASITDCSENGTGTLTTSYAYQGVSVTSGGTFTLWRGNISKFNAATSSSSPSSSRDGGGVRVLGTFTMNGGSIKNCTANAGGGGGVYVSGGTFIMNDGTITGNNAKTNHTSTSDIGCGGGVYGRDATITINGGTITDNKATNGGGLFTSSGELTIDGGIFTGNAATNAGGGLFLGLPNPIYDARGYTIVGWDSTIIKNATISNNTAVLGGGIYTYGAFRMSDTTITGNTATGFGGGIDSAVDNYTQENWVYELSGKMNITGNKIGEADNNLYLATGKKLPAVTGLAEGSTIGVTTGEKPLKDDGTIVPVYITSDAGNLDHFTSDENYVVKLDAEKQQLYIIAESSTVTVTLGDNMTASGSLKQTVLKNNPIADVTITAADGYYFPEDYAASLAKDGITVTRDSLTQITVSGTPTADEVALTLPAATAKTTPAAPSGLAGVAPSTWDVADGKISGTKTTMEWSKDGETWTDCTDGTTTVGIYGDYFVRVKATDISYASEATEVTVPKYLKTINFPAPSLSYTYTGEEHTLPIGDDGYTVEGPTKATDAGSYTVTVTLDTDKYQWSTTPESNTLTWIISKRAAQAADFNFTAPENLVWDGNPKTASITLNSPYTLGGCSTSLVYKQGDQVVENPTDPGTYQVYLVISGDGNFVPTDGLTADSWTFTIQHPTDHVWGSWQHDDTQHWRCCTVPGCTAEKRENHTTDTPATCTTKAVCTVCKSQYGKFDTHNHPAAKVISTAATAPTCGSKGNQAYSYCADCHKYFKDGDKNLYDDATHFAIAALTHKNAKKTNAVAPTCEVGGNDAYWYCADCGNYYADKDGKLDSTVAYNSNATFLKAALGHDFSGQPYEHDATSHWQICKHEGCTQETDHQAHAGNTATCVAESKCQVCDYKLADKNPNNHVNITKTEAKDPNCTEGGNAAYWYCDDCGKYFADEAGQMDTSKAYESNKIFLDEALGHIYNNRVVNPDRLAKPATCTEAPVYYFTCVRCDDHNTDKTFSMGLSLGHNFTKEIVDDAHLKTAATCTESAVYYYGCSRCDARSTEDTFTSGAPLGHEYTRQVVDAAHLVNPATCTKAAEYVYTCVRCDDHNTDKLFESGKPLGHDFTEKVVDDAHRKSAATCTKAAEYFYDCSRCDARSTDKFFTNGDPLGHDFTEKLPDDAHLKTAATCTESAVYYYDCSRCDARSTKDTYSYGAPLGHDFTEKVVDDAHLKTAATCTESAVYYYDCSRCDEHSTEDTYSHGTPLGHDFTEKIVDDAHLKTAATCTESAVYYYDCSRCDARSTDKTFTDGDPLGHSYTKEDTGAAHLKTAATCTQDAVYFKSCERCGVNGTETFTAVGTALGHDFAGQPYLHDETGHWQTCKRDGCDVTSDVEKHTSDEGKVTQEPTAAAEGEKTYTCTVCGEVLRTEIVMKLAPTIVEGANGKHQSGDETGLTFKSDAAFADFLKVCVDGKELNTDQYSAVAGSISVTLNSAFLNTLSAGEHTLDIVSASGTASTVFTVNAAPAVVPTGDTASLALWLSLAAMCGLGGLVIVSRKKRENG